MEYSYHHSSSKNESSHSNSNNDSGYVDQSFENSLVLINEEEQHQLSELNNRLAKYIEHIRQRENTAKSNRTIEELINIPSIQLENLKSVYELEIKSLRDALDKQSNETASVIVQNNKLIAENGNINRALEDRLSEIQQLTESLQKLEAENSRFRMQINLLQKNEILANTLSDQLKTCQGQLEAEVLSRTASDNACLTYKEKMEFNEAVFRKELGAMKMAHKSVLESMTTLKKDVTSSNLLGQMEEARYKLRLYLNDFRNSIDDSFLNTISKAANVIGEQVKTRSQLKNVNDELTETQHNLMVELERIKASHIKLENQLSDLQTVNEDEINQLRRIISELSQNKFDDLEHLVTDLNDSINTQIPLTAELCVYRKMLDSEDVRTDFHSLNSPNVKRRKVSSEERGTTRRILKASRHNKGCTMM